MNEPSSPAPPADVSAAATLRQLIMGFRVTKLIHVAAKLGLADHLEHGPQTPQALAQAVGAEPQALYRLLRALASVGLFAETVDGAFRLTPVAQGAADRPGWIAAWPGDPVWRGVALASLWPHALQRSDRPAGVRAHPR